MKFVALLLLLSAPASQASVCRSSTADIIGAVSVFGVQFGPNDHTTDAYDPREVAAMINSHYLRSGCRVDFPRLRQYLYNRCDTPACISEHAIRFE